MRRLNSPGNVYELRPELAHTLNSVIQVLQTLELSTMIGIAGCPSRLTCAVRGGKYSKLQKVRPSRSALASLSVIFMVANDRSTKLCDQGNVRYETASPIRPNYNRSSG